MRDALVWYVAYGSNLAADRFRVYLEGGSPPGASRVYAGARDPSAPVDDRPATLPLPLYFAGVSPTWGGGVAFVDPAPAARTTTLARAWLVTTGQLEDVVAQERGAPREAVDVEAVRREGIVLLGDGAHYGTLVRCAEIDGEPAITCTAPPEPDRPPPAAPTAPYLRIVGRGLADTHGLDAAAAARYLARCPGVDRGWDLSALEAVLAS